METTVILGIVFIIISYLVGCIPFGPIIGKVFAGIEVQAYGSKKPGGTNVWRTTGKAWLGILTILCDATFKGWFLMDFAKDHFEQNWIVMAAFVAVLLGHIFPVRTLFKKGGAGIAVLLGGLIVFVPGHIFFIAGLTWVAVFSYSRGTMSLANLVSILVLLFGGLIFNLNLSFLGFIAVVIILAFVGHRENLKRLFKERKERRIKISFNRDKVVSLAKEAWQKIKEVIEVEFE